MASTRYNGRILLDGVLKSAARRVQQQRVSASRVSSTSSRLFSSSSAIRKPDGPWSDPVIRPSNRYLVIAEDYNDAGALARRLEVRDRHLEQAARGKEVGRIELGGGLLKRDFKDIDPEMGPTTSLAGSVLIVQAESIEDVLTRLSQDEYSRASVFDPSKIRIFPFLRSLNEQSLSIGNEEVGDTKPVSLRKPGNESAVKKSFMSRQEVYVTNPKASGKSVNIGDRLSSENTLGHLRNTQKKPANQTTVTLDNLRKTPPLSSGQ